MDGFRTVKSRLSGTTRRVVRAGRRNVNQLEEKKRIKMDSHSGRGSEIQTEEDETSIVQGCPNEFDVLGNHSQRNVSEKTNVG